MGLVDPYSMEWRNYVRGLNKGDIKLPNDMDTLAWTWNRITGKLSAKLVYEAQWHNYQVEVPWWHHEFW